MLICAIFILFTLLKENLLYINFPPVNKKLGSPLIKLNLTSQCGVGYTFYIRLPYKITAFSLPTPNAEITVTHFANMQGMKEIKEMSILVSALVLMLSIMAWVGEAVLLALAGATLLTITLLNFTFYLNRERRESACHVLNISFLGYAFFFCLSTGGFQGQGALLLLFVPVTAMLYPDPRSGIPMVALTAFGILLMSQRPALGQPDLNLESFRIYYLALLLVLFCLGIFLVREQGRSEVAAPIRKGQGHPSDPTLDRKETARVGERFLAQVSHEIRNPMNGIVGMMHMLMDTQLNKTQRHYAGIVHSSAQALLGIVNDILDLSKIQEGKMALVPISFDLELAVEDMISLPALQARQKGIEFTHSIDEDVPRRMRGDIGRIRQVVLNLTGNAVKFTRDGAVKLRVSLVEDDKSIVKVRFTVDDTGIGIKDDKLDYVFGAFNQAEASTGGHYGGTGLGLPIAKSLVEQMGGRIGVESVEMVGSTFWFEIELEKQNALDYPSVEMDTGGYVDCRALVFSDTGKASGHVQRGLGALNITFDLVDDVNKALDAVEARKETGEPYHLVLIEAQESCYHADMLGELFMEAGVDSKYILVTAVGCKGEARRFQDIGFAAYLSKPMEDKLFQDCIRAVLSLPRDFKFRQHNIITRYMIEEYRKQTRQILVVDDMEANRLTAKALIEKQGYQTQLATSGADALSAVHKQPFDLILMDCQMPEMDGYEATRRIRKWEAEQGLAPMPIIAMTGNAYEDEVDRCQAAGMDDFITKPVQPDELGQKLRLIFMAAAGNAVALNNNKTAQEEENDMVLPFDRSALLSRFENDVDMIQAVVSAFILESGQFMDRMRTAIESGDVEDLELTAHAMKGSAANVNAEELRYLSLEMEENARAQDVSNARDLFVRIESALDTFTREARL